MTENTPPLNREQRRAQKFRSKSTGRQDNLQTQSENDSGFLTSPTETLADAPNDVVATSATEGPADTAEAGPANASGAAEQAAADTGAPAASADEAGTAATAPPR
jgi:hypothetical protein